MVYKSVIRRPRAVIEISIDCARCHWIKFGLHFNISIQEHDIKYCLEHVKPKPLNISSASIQFH